MNHKSKNPKSEIRKAKIGNQKSDIGIGTLETRNHISAIGIPEIRNQKSEIEIQKSEIGNQNSEIKNLKSEIRILKSDIGNQKSDNQDM